MKYVGAKAEAYCKSQDPKRWAFLIFGDDEGVVSDAARTLQRTISGDREDIELITLDQDQIKREPATLFDALEARSLLGNLRIIRIHTNGDKIAKLLLEAIALGEENTQRFEARLIITAGGLQKRSKLRTAIEGAKHAVALQLFADEIGDVSKLTRAALKAQKVDIEDEALQLFIQDLPGHRGLANQEIEKLALYGIGLGHPLSTDDIRALSTIDAEQALHDLVGSVLSGKTKATYDSLDRLTIAGTSPISILRALQRETLRLIQAHSLSSTGGDVGMKLRPPVFRNAWPQFRALMGIWSPKKLTRILERIHDAEQRVKSAGPTGNALVRKLLTDLVRVAAQSA